ncbi:MAG: YaiI/YqxD family protein [Pseudomonadota bacterium]
MACRIYIDADACPVKEETYKVAARHQVPVTVVSNSFLRVPRDPGITQIVVDAGADVADDWIAERADAHSVVITADILLAERCLLSGAAVLAPNGKPFTAASIGSQVATRALMDQLRGSGEITGGAPPFSAKDRSAFLQSLHETLTRRRRNA